jgi:hypothetical protein
LVFLILVRLSGIDNKNIESKKSTIFAFHITLKVHYNTLQSGLTIKCKLQYVMISSDNKRKPFKGIQNGHINVIAKMSKSFRQK